KGVMITHAGLCNYLSWAIEAYHVGAGLGSPLHSSIAFDLSVTALFPALLTGGAVDLLPEQQGVEALSAALLSHTKYSLVKISPAHLELLSQLIPFQSAAGRTLAFVIGGENLLAGSLNYWRDASPETALINEYGPTETVVGCCVYHVSEGAPRTGSVPIGRPIANTQLYILDPLLRPVPIGIAGELYIGGVGVAR